MKISQKKKMSEKKLAKKKLAEKIIVRKKPAKILACHTCLTALYAKKK
jgi:hypothetical protein